MKKAFAAILAGTMCAGMLVGCGASQATQSDSETDRAVRVSDYDGEITLVIATKDEFLGTLDNAVKAAAEIICKILLIICFEHTHSKTVDCTKRLNAGQLYPFLQGKLFYLLQYLLALIQPHYDGFVKSSVFQYLHSHSLLSIIF